MTPPEGLRHVRVSEATLHHPGTTEEYAEIVWQTVEEGFVFVTNLPKFSNGVPNMFGIFHVKRWATGWNEESFAELVANARIWAERCDTAVRFENGVPGHVLPAGMMTVYGPGGVAEHEDECEGAEDLAGGRKLGRLLPKPKLILHPETLDEVGPDIEPTCENAWTIFCTLVEGSQKIERDRAWVNLCARFGAHQQAFTENEWSLVIKSLKSVRDRAPKTVNR